jgi:hypothetical protein
MTSICHAIGDRCHGCAHYRGEAPICVYATAEANSAHNAALDAAAAIARANTSAPRIWRNGAWFNPHGDEIAQAIEALKVTS